MIDFIMHAVPWWAYVAAAVVIAAFAFRYLGLNGVLAILGFGAVAAIYAKGRKTGVETEHAKQVQADDHARVVIQETKEDVRAIPNTPAGKAERNERFDKWVK